MGYLVSTVSKSSTDRSQGNGLNWGRRTIYVAVGLVGLICGLTWALRDPSAAPQGPSTITPSGFALVATYPHDAAAYTQGLTIDKGVLFEGTGKRGKSSLRQVDLASGKVLRSVALNPKYFGEGITVWKDSIIQLTWTSGHAFVFDRDTFEFRKAFRYTGEGWGLTHDGTHLIMSDGSSRLRFLDPESFKVVRRISVHQGRTPIGDLNELEFVEGEIFANVWYNDSIARISPEDGRILGWIDLHKLWPAKERPTRDHVLNGIAYDSQAKRLFVTGKNWPQMFEIRLDRLP